jgi:hypothetical protein
MGEAEFDQDADGSCAPDLATVDALARVQLVARRHGCRIRLMEPDPALVELIELAGLREVLGLDP